MANPKINAILSFATQGIGAVAHDVKSVSSAVDSASSAADKLTKKLSQIQKGVALQSVVAAASAVKGAFSAVSDVIGGAVSTVYGLAESQTAAADKIGKTSALLGMEVGELQALRSAGMHAGLTLEGVDSAMEKFSITMSKAVAGEKSQIELFNALGVVTKNADGSIRNQTDILMDVADAYTLLTNSQDRNRVSQELFGKSAVQMSELLKDGSAGIRGAVAQYEKTNAGFTSDQAVAAAAFNDELQTMREFIGGIGKDLSFALVPAFTKLFTGVYSFIEKNRPQIDGIVNKLSNKLPSVIDDITSALPVVLSGVSMVASAVSAVVDFTGPWIPILTAAGALLGGAILTAVCAVGAAVATIGPAFAAAVVAAAPIVGIVAGISAGVAGVSAGVAGIAYGIYKTVQNWDMLKSFVVDDVFPAFINGVKVFANYFIDAFAVIADGVAKLPIIGEKIAGGAGDWWRSQRFDVGSYGAYDAQSIPLGEENAAVLTGAPVSSSSSLTVDFRGVPRGTKITPSANFDYGNIDYSAGYAFGG